MANASAPPTAGKLVSISFVPGAVLAKADIAIPVYLPDIETGIANPILSIGHTDLTGTLVSAYAPNNYDAALGAGTFDVHNSRNIRLGDATAAKSILDICYLAARDIKRD